jgi:CubicO group peptidase (beta-lactamase class C family)
VTTDAAGSRSAGRAAVEGVVDARFQPVADAVAAAVDRGEEKGCAVSIYVDGRCAVDAWCGTGNDGAPWQRDTLSVIYSSTKGAVALMAQMLHDRGELDVEAPVVRYWPKFGAAGKQATTVRHLLAHSSGAITFPHYWEALGEETLGLADWDLVTSQLAAAPPAWQPGSVAGYHAITYGHLVGEVIRRVTGMSPGAFFAREVAAPLGLDIHIGHVDELHRIADSRVAPSLSDPAMREAARRAVAASQEALRATGDVYQPAALLVHAPIFMHYDRSEVGAYIATLFNRPSIRAAEIPGSNGIGDARSLARMYALLACGGSLDGVTLVGEESTELFSALQPQSTDLFRMCLGYHRLRDDARPPHVPGIAFGHSGAGGTLGFADPEHRLSFGYTHNQMLDETFTTALVRTVYACLGYQA